MNAIRGAVLLAGLVSIGYGAVMMWTENPWLIIMRIGVWAAAGVVLHDFLFAPICVAIGMTGRRLLPTAWRAPVAVGALITVTLLLLSIPVYDRPGARPDNATVLDRNYHQGLWWSVGMVWLAVAFWVAGVILVRRRHAPGDATVMTSRPASYGSDDTSGEGVVTNE